MPNQDVIIKAFTGMAPNYEEKVDVELRRFWGWSYSDLVDQVLAETPVLPHDRVLDIATGTAVIPLKLAAKSVPPASITGLDIASAMLKRGKDKIARSRTGVSFNLTCGSAMMLPFCEGSYNRVTCGLAAHHLDLQPLLAEIYRVLKPGGSLTIADVGSSALLQSPVLKPFITIAAFLYFLFSEGPSRALAEADSLPHIYTADEWTSHLYRAGFHRVRLKYLDTSRSWAPAALIIGAGKV